MANKSEGRLSALTGLRFLAAACIVVHHSRGCFGIPVEFGFRFAFDQAVTFFFLLSGFILAYNYPDLSRPGDWGRFWLARWSRVWPAHVATFLLVLAILAWDQVDVVAHPSRRAMAANLLLVQGWFPAWNAYFSYNAPAWSISAEWAFYLCFPFLITNWRRTWWLKLGVTFGLAAGTIGLSRWLALPFLAPGQWKVSTHGLVYINPLGNLFAFTVGIALVPLFRRLQERHWRRGFSTVAESLVLAGAVCAMARSPRWAEWFIHNWWPQLGAAGMQWLGQGNASLPAFAALVVVMGLGRGWYSRLLGHPVMVTLGEISFSLYLVHQPLRRWYCVRYPAGSLQPNLFAYVGWVVLSLGFAYLNWRFVERPCRKWLMGLWPKPVSGEPSAQVPLRRAA
jgi:peptidoglycan/LPS O-acetylase OafA/YrhL